MSNRTFHAKYAGFYAVRTGRNKQAKLKGSSWKPPHLALYLISVNFCQKGANKSIFERKVAIKLIYPRLTESEYTSARFKQEAKAAASLAHPNVVTVHDFGVAEYRRAYLVMELLNGSTLRHELPQNIHCPRISILKSAV